MGKLIAIMSSDQKVSKKTAEEISGLFVENGVKSTKFVDIYCKFYEGKVLDINGIKFICCENGLLTTHVKKASNIQEIMKQVKTAEVIKINKKDLKGIENMENEGELYKKISSLVEMTDEDKVVVLWK